MNDLNSGDLKDELKLSTEFNERLFFDRYDTDKWKGIVNFTKQNTLFN